MNSHAAAAQPGLTLAGPDRTEVDGRGPAPCACPQPGQCPISDGPCPGVCVFASVMHSANLGIVVFDVAGDRLVFANAEARELLEGGGLPVDYASARSVFAERASADPESLPGSSASRRLGARLIGYSSYKSGPVEWIFCRDISEKARLEAVAEAIELSNSFGHVFTAVRHEIGNPINSAKMALSVLRRNFDRLGREAALEYLDSTLKELERVGDLLATLRSFNLYENLEPLPLEIDGFLAEFLGFVGREFQERGIALAFGQRAPGAVVLADPRALRQVLIGLLANAADALGRQAGAAITVDCAATQRLLVLEIRDNGPGIPQESIPHLFKPFFTTKARGTGMGLVIARKLLARMSATIAIENYSGRGVCARITLRRTAP